jgi:hypothetical protein
MGLGKTTRALGKVGLALEVGRYAFLAGRALWRAIKGKGDEASPDAVLPEDASPPSK